jgi:hypothetical protein
MADLDRVDQDRLEQDSIEALDNIVEPNDTEAQDNFWVEPDILEPQVGYEARISLLVQDGYRLPEALDDAFPIAVDPSAAVCVAAADAAQHLDDAVVAVDVGDDNQHHKLLLQVLQWQSK